MLLAQADNFFKNASYIKSAQCYAQCSASFEEVTLKFIDMGEREALRYYLVARLERTRKSVSRLIPSSILQCLKTAAGSYSADDAGHLVGRNLSRPVQRVRRRGRI